MGRSAASDFQAFINKLTGDHAASYMQDAVHILGAVRDFAKAPMSCAANEEYRGQVVGLCHGLIVKIHRDHKDALARAIPESIRVLANRIGSPLHQWNTACEIVYAAIELLDKMSKLPDPPPKPPKKDPDPPKSSRRAPSRRQLPS